MAGGTPLIVGDAAPSTDDEARSCMNQPDAASRRPSVDEATSIPSAGWSEVDRADSFLYDGGAGRHARGNAEERGESAGRLGTRHGCSFSSHIRAR